MWSWSLKNNPIRGVMVSLLVSTAVDRGFVPRLGQTKDYKISICCFWLARNQDNVSEWRDMSIRGLFFQWANTINIPINKRGGLAIVQSSSHWKLTCSRHDIAERKIAELALKQQSLTNSMHSYVKVLHCDSENYQTKVSKCLFNIYMNRNQLSHV